MALALAPGPKANNRPYEFGFGLGLGLGRKADSIAPVALALSGRGLWEPGPEIGFVRPSIFYSWAGIWLCRTKEFLGWGLQAGLGLGLGLGPGPEGQ